MSKHFLFVMWEGGGNVSPMLGVAATLLAKGHRVTVLGDPTIQEEAQQLGCGFTPWRTAPHRKSLRIEEDLLRDWETGSPLAGLRNYRDKFVAGPAAQYAADTLEAIDAVRPDVMVSEYTLFGAFMAAEKRQIPAAGLVPNIWPLAAACGGRSALRPRLSSRALGTRSAPRCVRGANGGSDLRPSGSASQPGTQTARFTTGAWLL